MRILHTADWHLDASFSGLAQSQRSFMRQQLQKIPAKVADLAREHQCDLILIAGDVFDGPYTQESLRLARGALGGCGLPVFISPGNHDFCSPQSPWIREAWPENVHIFTGDLESVVLPGLDCRIYGAGYRSMDCQALLEGFTASGPERWKLGLIHADPTAGTSPYCPVTTAQVRASGLDYLALGHIHKAGSFTAGETLCAWPGCPMGRGFDETGDKGVYIVDLEAAQSLTFLSLDCPRIFDLEVDTGPGAQNALEGVLPGVPTQDIYRITLTGGGEGEPDALYAAFSHIPGLVLCDSREEPVDLWSAAGEDSLEGTYFTMLRELAEGKDGEAAGIALLAAEISRKLLDGREVSL